MIWFTRYSKTAYYLSEWRWYSQNGIKDGGMIPVTKDWTGKIDTDTGKVTLTKNDNSQTKSFTTEYVQKIQNNLRNPNDEAREQAWRDEDWYLAEQMIKEIEKSESLEVVQDTTDTLMVVIRDLNGNWGDGKSLDERKNARRTVVIKRQNTIQNCIDRLAQAMKTREKKPNQKLVEADRQFQSMFDSILEMEKGMQGTVETKYQKAIKNEKEKLEAMQAKIEEYERQVKVVTEMVENFQPTTGNEKDLKGIEEKIGKFEIWFSAMIDSMVKEIQDNDTKDWKNNQETILALVWKTNSLGEEVEKLQQALEEKKQEQNNLLALPSCRTGKEVKELEDSDEGNSVDEKEWEKDDNQENRGGSEGTLITGWKDTNDWENVNNSSDENEIDETIDWEKTIEELRKELEKELKTIDKEMLSSSDQGKYEIAEKIIPNMDKGQYEIIKWWIENWKSDVNSDEDNEDNDEFDEESEDVEEETKSIEWTETTAQTVAESETETTETAEEETQEYEEDMDEDLSDEEDFDDTEDEDFDDEIDEDDYEDEEFDDLDNEIEENSEE